MRRDMMTARFKRDYVAFLAVLLFFLIVGLEIGVAVWIPMQMHKESLFAEAVARIQTQRRFDVQRQGLRRLVRDSEDPMIRNESQMLLDQLDVMAIYLQSDDRGKRLSKEQVDQLASQLHRVDFHINRLRGKRPVSRPLTLDTSEYIKLIVEDKI